MAKTTKKGYVKLTLAHPLPPNDARRLGLEPPVKDGVDGDIPVGTEVELHPARARDVIGAGYAAGVNPQNRAQVREALGLTPQAAAAAAQAPAATPPLDTAPATAATSPSAASSSKSTKS